jgi:hypothetical protein
MRDLTIKLAYLTNLHHKGGIEHVMALGHLHVKHKQQVIKGTFE